MRLPASASCYQQALSRLHYFLQFMQSWNHSGALSDGLSAGVSELRKAAGHPWTATKLTVTGMMQLDNEIFTYFQRLGMHSVECWSVLLASAACAFVQVRPVACHAVNYTAWAARVSQKYLKVHFDIDL
jgi:hypothetical protein